MASIRSIAALGAAWTLLGAPAYAAAADPGTWALAGVARAPAVATAGVAQDGSGARFLSGGETLLRTDGRLQTELTLRAAIPGELVRAPGFDRVGDPGWDAAGSRLIVPLSCSSPQAGCGRGGLAVLGRDLAWRVGVTLDDGDGPAARWAEPAPDGSLIWTSAGTDLLAYRALDLVSANATPTGGPIRAAVRLAAAAPAGTITGGVFWDGRLYLSAQDGGTQRIWSVDVAALTPQPRLEIERSIAGAAGGLDAGPARGGLLHWLIAPPAAGGPRPTYGAGAPVILAFTPAGDGALAVSVDRRTVRAGRPAWLTATVRQTLRGVSSPLADVAVSAGGATARTDADGVAELRVRPLRPGALAVRATSAEVSAPPATVNVLPAIGLPLAGPPTATISAGRGALRVRANELIDCSGSYGCESPRARLRPRGCISSRAGADVRVVLRRRPARFVDVLVQDARGRVADGGRAIAQGRNALGWRFPVRGSLPSRGTLTIFTVYPDRTGAITVLRLRSGGC